MTTRDPHNQNQPLPSDQANVDSAVPTSDSHPASRLDSCWWLKQTDRWLIAVVVMLLIFCLSGELCMRNRWGVNLVEIRDIQPGPDVFQLDVNSASWVEWLQLEGIGETLARRIVADREERGPFRSIDDVARVKGIGKKTVEKLRPWLRCNLPVDAADRKN